MINTIKPKIKALLESCTTLSVVYDYHTPTPDAYPCATFELESVTNEEYDSCNNKVVYTFDTFIVQNVDEETSRDSARGIIDSVLDEVIEKCNLNNTLDADSYRNILESIQIFSVKSDKGQAIACALKIRCETLTFNLI